MIHSSSHGRSGLWVLISTLLFSLCTACGSGSSTTTEMHTVAGMVQGVPEGTTLTLEITGGERVTVSQDGSFEFRTPIAVGTAYEIRVVGAPAGRAVTITNGSGTVTNSMRTIQVQVVPGHSVGGIASGVREEVRLRLHDGQVLSLTQDGAFAFPLLVPDGQSYSVAIESAPVTQRTSLTNATGTIASTNVEDVLLTCLDTFTVGGTVSGLLSPISLQLNDNPGLPVTANGSFVFPTRLVSGESYEVTLLNSPPGQNTTITQGSGTIGATSIVDVTVVCSDRFLVGGTVRGLVGTATMTLNEGIPLQVEQNGTFQFAEGLEDGATYDAQLVGITNSDEHSAAELLGGNGTVQGADVTDLELIHYGLWQHPASATANLGGTDAIASAAAVDLDGTAIYAYSDGGELRISTYDGTTWTDTATDRSNDSGQDDVRVAADLHNDTGVVAWTEWDGSVARVYAIVRADGLWSQPTALSHDSTDSFDLDVDVGPNGTAVVLFTQLDDTVDGHRSLYASTLSEGSWTLPSDLDDKLDPDGYDSYAPQVEMDGQRNVVAAWTQVGPSVTRLMTAQRTGGTWFTPQIIENSMSFEGTSADEFSLDVNDAGTAMLAWGQSDGSDDRVYLATYSGGAWTRPAQITAHALPAEFPNARQPSIALREDGTALLAWITSHGNPLATNVFARVYDGQSWDAVTLQDALDAGTSPNRPVAAVRTDGDALVVWRDSGDNELFSNAYRGGRFTGPSGSLLTPALNGEMVVGALEFGPTGLGVMAFVHFGFDCGPDASRAYRSFVHR